MLGSFKWSNGTVFIKPATGRTRTYYFHLKSKMGVYDMPDGFERESYEQALYLLARVDHVEGDIGFQVPNGDATDETLMTFCNNLLDADELLFVTWNSIASTTRVASNEPHLLPSNEVSDTKKKLLQTQDENKE